MNGVLLVNKPYGVTSRDVVNSVSKILNIKKVGHTGTLDPIATGVLVLCVGSYTRLADILTAEKKEYVAEAIFGMDSDTLDITGKIVKNEKIHLDESTVIDTLNGFIGTYNQEVPKYSAVKVNGKKLYEYARNNIDVVLPSKMVEIFEIELLDIKYEDGYTVVKFRTLVSKGTYIRSLIRDIAKTLNTCGIMKSLVRTKQGSFNIEDCYLIDDLNDKFSFINLYDYMNKFERVILNDDELAKVLNGSILDNKYGSNEIAFFDSKKKLVGIYEIYDKDNSKIKPLKIVK